MNNTIIFNGTVTDDVNLVGVTLITDGMKKTCEIFEEIVFIKGLIIGGIITLSIILLIRFIKQHGSEK